MAELLLSDITATLKDVLLPYVRDNFPKKTIALDQFKRDSEMMVMNDEFLAPVYTTRHGGVANLADDGNSVISSGGRDTSRATVSVEIVTGALNISKLTIDASKSNTLSVQNTLQAQTEKLSSDFARQVNRQLYGGGDGVVSMVRASGGSVGTGTVAVEAINADIDDGRAVDYYGTINGDISPTKYFAVDQVVGVGTAGAADGTITSVTGTTFVSGAPTAIATNANDAVYIQDGSGEGAGTSEILGIRAALSSSTGTSTYAGLARNVVGWTPSFGSVSEALSLGRLEQMDGDVQEYADTQDKYIILVNKTLYRKYGDLLTAMRRTVNQTDLLGGWKGLEFAAGGNVVGVFRDYDVPDGEVLFINLSTWKICQVSDVSWMEEPGGTGGGLLRLQNTIQYQAVMHWFVNTICLAPAANGKQTRKSA
jgi:hypothetical protein